MIENTKASDLFVSLIEKSTGKTIEEIRDTPLAQQWEKVEQELGHPIQCVSMFPVIGRSGSVLRDRVMTEEESDKAFQEAMAIFKEALKNG